VKEKTDKLLSVTEAAERLGVIRQRVFQLIKSDRLPAVMVGSQYVIKETDLKLVEDRPTGRPPKDKD
jgi:excisionase family DNA binding protein